MVRQVAGTSQWRKLVQTVEYHDTYGSIWRLSTWKVLFWMVLILAIFIVAYSYFAPNQVSYFQETLFYAIITMVIIIVIWLAGNFIWKSREFFVGFLIGLILIFGFYALMGFLLSFVGFRFHYGFTTWLVMTCLALIGARIIDGKLDKKDVLFGLLIFIVLVSGNAPAFEDGAGFFEKVDVFIVSVSDILSKIVHPEDIIAE